MNGTRANRRKHEYRGGQASRDLTAAEKKEFASSDYSVTPRDQSRVLRFKETGIPYTKNYVENKEAFDALRKARFETKVPLWPRDKDGRCQTFADLQVKVSPSGDAKNAAEAKIMNTFYPHQDYVGGLFCSVIACFRCLSLSSIYTFERTANPLQSIHTQWLTIL